MGIEPFLCIAVVALGILLQCGLALRDRLVLRLREGIWMRERLARLAGRHGLLSAGEGAWSGTVRGVGVRLWTTSNRFAVRRRVRQLAGGWQTRTRSALRLGEPHLLIEVELPVPIAHALRLQAAIGRGGHVPLHDLIADQLVRANGDDPEGIRRLVRDSAVRGPLYEVLGRFPQSVVTAEAVLLWVEEPVPDVEALLALATELAVGMASVAREVEPQAERRPARLRVTAG